MNTITLKADAVLLLTATIWGFAFVAQRVGMEYVGPFTFNGIRFAIGSLVLIPFLKFRLEQPAYLHKSAAERRGHLIGGVLLTGSILFAAASLQQVGIKYTTAGNAGFITGLYVVFVPFLGLFQGQRADAGTWLGAVMAALGLYLLSVTGGYRIAFGDLLELGGAVLWALHVIVIARLAPLIESPRLAFGQFAVCALLSLAVALLAESVSLSALIQASAPILYGGLLSVGVAYTLQVVGQRHAPPAHAAILLSLEAAFAALGGWLLLDERLTARALLGCALMMGGMLVSQLYRLLRARAAKGKGAMSRYPRPAARVQ